MTLFLKVTAGALITLVMYLILSKQNKDISLILTVVVCCMVATAAINYLEPVIDLFDSLQVAGNLQPEFIKILLRAVGIGLISELTTLVCNDCGNAALGKALQILAASVILCISVPLFNELIRMIKEILESV